MADAERKLKVEAFYKKYAPTEMAKVANALSLKVSEPELFKLLRDKYKITDTTGIAVGQMDDASAGIKTSHFGVGGEDGKRQRIEAFYKKYAPAEISKVDNAMKAKNSEAELFKLLREKYKITETFGIANGELETAVAAVSAAPAAAGGGSTDDLRGRVTAFFQKYAPQDLSKVDKTLSFGLPEDELFSRLRQKYNVTEEPSSPARNNNNNGGALTSSGSFSNNSIVVASGGDTYRDRVIAFLEKYAPADARKVDKIMGFNLPEEELMPRLCTKYGVTDYVPPTPTSNTPPISPGAAGPGGEGGETQRDRVRAFLEVHAPQDVPRLDKILSHGLAEEELMGRLRAKYNVPEPASPAKARTSSIPPAANNTATNGSPAGSGSADGLRDRVKAFLEKHAPADVARLDKILSKGLSEEDLMKALRAKYNVSEETSAAPAPSGNNNNNSNNGGAGGGGLKEKVVAFMEKHAPQDISKADKAVALGAQVGEEELFVRLRQKYNVTESANNAGGSASSGESLKDKVTEFFKKHSPNDMHRVDKAVALGNQVGEEELFKKLREKYCTSGAASGVDSGRATPVQKSASEPGSPGNTALPPLSPVSPPHVPVAEKKQEAPPAIIPEPTAPIKPAVVQQQQQPPVVIVAPIQQQQQQQPVVAVTPATPARSLPQIEHQPVVQQQQQQPQKPIVQAPHFANPIAVTTFVSKFMDQQNHKIEELLFSLQQREDAIANREKAIEAREIAFESRCLSLGAEPTRVIFEAAGQQTAEFVAHMVDVESALAAATADLIRFEKSLRLQETDMADREALLQKKEKHAVRDEEERKQRIADRERDVQKQTERLMEMNATQESDRKRLLEITRSNAEKESELAGREARLMAQLDSLRQKEAGIHIQQEATSKEREASRKFSEELLQREGTVRAVERSLNAARAELTRLENDVALHAKKLLEDQRALRRWSEELERREERFQRKNPNGK